jgi:predicted DNA-binding transcriptional regulator
MWCCRRIEEITWNDYVKKEGLQRVNVERNVLQTRKIRKANWIGYILLRNGLLKHVIERKKEG